jgi:tripartite-type tricarboxylate transporter receptor subunit TctC
MQTRSDSTPASTAQWLNDEIAKWEPIIKGAGIKAD